MTISTRQRHTESLGAIRLRVSDARQVLKLGFLLFARDFQYRFKLTYFGYLWAAMRPLLTALPIIFVGRTFNFGGANTTVPYALSALSGIVLFQVFWDSLYYPQWIMRRLRRIVEEVGLGHMAVLIAGLSYALFNVVVYAGVIALGMLYFGVAPAVTAPLALLSLPLVMLSGLSIGALLAPISLVYLDLRYSLPLVASALLWTTPAMYTAPETGLLSTINDWNPVTYLIDIPRSWLFGMAGRSPGSFLLCVGLFLALLVVSLRVYPRAMRIAADAIM